MFTSSRPLGRAENVSAVWDKCPFDKEFALISPTGECDGAETAGERGFDVIVTDEFLQKVDKPRVGVVMIGHGIDGMKLYGLDQRTRYFTQDQTSQIDWYVTGSEHTRSFCSTAAGIPLERCVALGMPRTDAYVGKRKGDGGTLMAGYARAYLYAPTLRAGWEPPAPDIDWAMVDSQLSDDEVLVVKRHMVMRSPITTGGYRHIVEVPPSEPSTPYLVDCDVVISDYSSIVLDGYVLGKPSVLFCPDAEGYCNVRGFYREFPKCYTDRPVHDQLQIVRTARAACGDGASAARFRERYANMCDGHSSERVIDLVRSMR